MKLNFRFPHLPFYSATILSTLALFLFFTTLIITKPKIGRTPQVFLQTQGNFQIIYTSQGSAQVGTNKEIYLINSSNSYKASPINLSNNPANDYSASFSKDAKKIVFLSDRVSPRGIYTMDFKGENVQLVLQGEYNDPSFSPDANKIIFEQNNDIFVYDGTTTTNLTNNPALQNQRPVFSPDGAKIVYLSCEAQDCGLFVMNNDGSSPVRLTSSKDCIINKDSGPAYLQTPASGVGEGDKIVFSCQEKGVDNTPQIYLTDDKTGPTQKTITKITQNQGWNTHPGFSPEGSKIVFTSNLDNRMNEGVFIMDLDGQNSQRLTTDSDSTHPLFLTTANSTAFFLPSPSPSSSPSPSPSPIPTGGFSVTMKIKFDGIPANNNIINLVQSVQQKPVRVKIVKELDETQIFPPDGQEGSLIFTYTDNGIWTAQLPSLANLNFLDKYLFKLKGFAHRQILFCQNNQTANSACSRGIGITLVDGGNDLDFSGYPLDFGDINQDRSVGVADYSLVKACRNLNATRGEANYTDCEKADGNLDGVVDSTDIDLLYKTLSTKPDDE